MSDVVGAPQGAKDAPQVVAVSGAVVPESDGVGRATTHDLLLEIGRGPICPKCQLDTFDDWWHDPSFKHEFGVLVGRLKCHGCGSFFSMTRYGDGDCHSRIWQKKRLTKATAPIQESTAHASPTSPSVTGAQSAPTT